jgi:hypothetical protein
MTRRPLPARTLPEHPHVDQLKATSQGTTRGVQGWRPAVAEIRAHYHDCDSARFDARRSISSRACVPVRELAEIEGFVDGATGHRLVEPIREGRLGDVRALLSPSLNSRSIFDVTRNPADVGKFKAPTLRNIAVTGPYMHDGSVATLEEAIDHYAAGGRTIADCPYAGIGRDNPNESQALLGFVLTSDQPADLVAFLRSLTDDALLRDPRFGNPFSMAARMATSSESRSLVALDAVWPLTTVGTRRASNQYTPS